MAVLPEYIAPMKPVIVARLPEDKDQWIYEIKFDGYRVIALKAGRSVELWSASHKPLTFPSIAAAIAKLPCTHAVIDGEIVALDPAGRSSFQLLQNVQGGDGSAPICLYAFDLLRLDGADLRELGTVRRKEQLAALLKRAPDDPLIRYSGSLDGEAAQILDAAARLGLEGIVAKERDAQYQTGVRSAIWQKIKLVREQDFVIGGYTRPEGTRKYFGAVLVGYYQEGKLLFAARAGSGFSSTQLSRMYEMFQPLRQTECPFVNLPAPKSSRWGQAMTASVMKSCTWLEPSQVCRVRFAEWTSDGGLRQPVFLGLRDDKIPRQVVRESTV